MVTVKQKFLYLAEGEIDLESWFNKISKHYALDDIERIRKAAHLTQQSSAGITTFYGQPCIEQGLEMAEILLDMHLDQTAIAASIVTSALQHTKLSIETVETTLGMQVSKLAQGVLQMNVLNHLQQDAKNRNKQQLDRIRKIFLAMVSDIRVVLIKLAERTCIMRGIKQVNPTERKHIAQETMDIYAPLANRLGIGQLKWELEDIAFHYINPDVYKTIADFLAERRIDRKERIDRIIQALSEKLKQAGIQAKIAGRAKHIYSIYLKKQRKDIDYKDIYDYSAIRLLVPKIEDCYTALSIVHSLYEHIPEEFDDYISNPKPNGYRSIHTAVIGPQQKTLEIQIRTQDMHTEAEHGVAAHWIYKEAKTPQSGYEAKIAYLRQLLAWHKEMARDGNTPTNSLDDMPDDTVYVFTPAGEIMDLPMGSTPLDFAYHLHSELGHRCRGAKVKGHIVPLTYSLRTGDQIEIITAPQGTPSRDWLNKEFGYLKSARARSKVTRWFKQQDISQHVETGKHTLERELTHANEKTEKPLPQTTAKNLPLPHGGLQIAGISDLLTRIAKCCKPIPGDAIVGYITQGRGVSIHRQDCNNVTGYDRHPQSRMIQVNWDENSLNHYYVDLQIRANGQHDFIKEITALLANAKVDLIALNSTLNKRDHLIFVILTIQIQDVMQLKNILNQISQLPKVIQVQRMNES